MFCVAFGDFGRWAKYQTVFSATCNSDFEMLAALPTAEAVVVRTQMHRLDEDKFPMFSGS